MVTSIGQIKALEDTWIKIIPLDSSELKEREKSLIKKGTVLDLRWLSNETEKGHRKIDLMNPIHGFFSWFTYISHWEVIEKQHPRMEEFQVEIKPERLKGKLVMIPGVGQVGLLDPISPNALNFSWAEFTAGGTRIPRLGDTVEGIAPEQISRNIIKIAEALQGFRDRYGPVKINSGYRPPSVNRAVGGASSSRHLYGDAVDFVIPGVSSMVIVQQNSDWPGGLAGTASNVFTHLDCRNYRARFSYPF